MKNIQGLLLVGCSALALAGCGPSDIASPGTGGDVIIENPNPTPTPGTPTPTPGTVTPAAGCPTIEDPQGLVDGGTITGPEGTWRVCRLPERINTSTTLTKVAGLVYELGGRVDVGTDGGAVASADDTNVTLTIQPGVIIFGGTGVSWLHVNRGNKIAAVGTPTAPIIFTSRANVEGKNTDDDQGQWGGVVLSGRAPVTDCTVAPAAAPGTAECERGTEGAVDPAIYGGEDKTYNAGKMQYVQIRYSGYVLSGNSELQALTLQGVGTGTELEYIQSVNSSDDSMEIFGGLVNMKHYIAVGADDDMLDTDTGTKTNLQYVIAVQRPGAGDSLIEADSDNPVDGNLPRQNTQIANFTFVATGSASNGVAMLLRGGTDYAMVNGVIAAPMLPCLRISRTQTASTTVNSAIEELGAPHFHSVVMQCNSAKYLAGTDGPVSVDTISSIFNVTGGNNRDDFTPTLTSVFINGANESGVPAFDPKLLVENDAAEFFDSTTWIGAVRDANDTWYTRWTCNTAAANFGSDNSGNCTSLPTT